MPAIDCSQAPEPLSPIKSANLIARGKPVRVTRGRNLLARGECSSRVFVVVEGTLQVILYSAAGRQVSLRELTEGDILASWPPSMGKIAVPNSRVFGRPHRIQPRRFLKMSHSSQQTVDWLLGELAARVRRLTNKIFELSVLNVQTRLHCELLRLAQQAEASGHREIYSAPTHIELAHRIGANREAITREMRALSAHNIIRTKRRRLEFIDIGRLRESAERAGIVGGDPTEHQGD
jgi:CRP/FNR family transcriptional regulator, cyclic AMP receptor protein